MLCNSSHLILHGEDDHVDSRAMQRILAKLDYAGTYENISKGSEVVERVSLTGKYAGQNLARPDIILLDIGLPVLIGTEVLKELRQIETARSIPVIMLSGSNSTRDFYQSIQLGANGYIQKTADIKMMSEICGGLIGVWDQMGLQKFL